MSIKDKKEEDRPLAYPKPTEADKQLQNQPEYIDQEPNIYAKEMSDVPGEEANEQEASQNTPGEGT